jgi:NADPH:quinone reductase-like Zn-dependent oxidoreductase
MKYGTKAQLGCQPVLPTEVSIPAAQDGYPCSNFFLFPSYDVILSTTILRPFTLPISHPSMMLRHLFKQTAIIGRDDGSLGISDDVDIPELEGDMILVKNMAVALNPIDAKMVGKLATPGAIAGMDFAGEVIAIGPNVHTAVPIQVGDRVCGAVPGMHSLTPTVGAFAQFVGAADLTTMKIPNYMSFEEAASLGSGIGTIGLALFKSLDVPGTPNCPAKKPLDVLVYGGSTATGTLAIQLLKL